MLLGSPEKTDSALTDDRHDVTSSGIFHLLTSGMCFPSAFMHIYQLLPRRYLAFNPALERTLHGPDVHQGLGFAPGVKVSYDFTREISGGLEYYAD